MEETSEKKDFGKEFEEEVKIFLETLGFSDVKGGPDFHIAPPGQTNQIDACGRFKDVLFIFECKASGKKTKKSLRQDILATKERARIAFENYKNIPEYSSCSFLRFIFITKKIEIPDVQKELFKGSHIYYADHQALEYYTDLYEKIGEYATYNFLADFRIHPPANEQLKVTALKTILAGHKIYTFFARPKLLLKFAYVARRRSENEYFYQRMLDKTRIKKIQNFIDNGGIFPTNIILSLKDTKKSFNEKEPSFTFKRLELNFATNPEIGILTISRSYNACWIIDGQHRLYSFARAKSNVLVPCIAFEKIDIEDERGFFLEINREQRPIQPDLIWDLEGLSNPNSARGIISNIVHTLNKDATGPFFDKIYIPVHGSRAGKMVNMAAFCNGILNAAITREITPNLTGLKNPLSSGEPWTVTKRIAQVINRYFTPLKERLNEEHQDFVFGNAGIPIMLYLLEPIVAYIKRIPSSADLYEFTTKICSFFETHFPNSEDIRKLRSEMNSEGARKSLARDIGIYIRSETKKNKFWPEMEQSELVSEIIEMERRISNCISLNLSQITTGWEKLRVPQPIYLKAKERMENDGTRFDENLSLGDELQIIMQKNNWDEVFKVIMLSKKGFSKAEEVKLAFEYLSKIRNPVSHGKSVILSKDDLDQCELYLKKFSRIIPDIIPEYPATNE